MSDSSAILHPKNYKISALAGMQDLWGRTMGNPDICIAVIDGDIDHQHSCFKGAGISSVSTPVNGVASTKDAFALEHGTSVASIIFGQHHSNIKGVAPGCTGIIIPVFGKDGKTQTTCSQLDLAQAIQLAEEKGANIINISGGEFSPSGKSDATLAGAIEKCSRKGVIIISAVGNDGCRCLHVPAAENQVLAVGAMDENNAPLNFSNWGNAYKKNGLLFPGKDILSAIPHNKSALKSGTSFATPIASGISALLLSLMIKMGRKPDGRLVYDSLLKTAFRCKKTSLSDCEKTLAGIINLPGAMQEIIEKCKPSTFSYLQQSSSLPHQRRRSVVPMEFIPRFTIQSNSQQTPNSNHKKKEEKFMSHIDQKIALSSVMPEENEMDEIALNMLPSAITSANGVTPSDCGCHKKAASSEVQTYSDSGNGNDGNGNGSVTTVTADNGNGSVEKKQPVIAYAVGALGYEFRTEASRDSFQQAMNGNPYDPNLLLSYLEENPEANEDICWTLSLDATPIYILIPYGGFAASIYTKIRAFYKEQLAGNVSRVSVPGMIVGQGSLMTGQELPYLMPKGQGMYSWSTAALVQAVMGAQPAEADASSTERYNTRMEGLENFLDRVYYELRNLGITPQERAINFAATNAFQIGKVFEKAAGENMELDTIDVDRSPICKHGSDCWDVKLVFFNPAKRTEQARRIYRFTIDVSNIIPVTVGGIRNWNIF